MPVALRNVSLATPTVFDTALATPLPAPSPELDRSSRSFRDELDAKLERPKPVAREDRNERVREEPAAESRPKTDAETRPSGEESDEPEESTPGSAETNDTTAAETVTPQVVTPEVAISTPELGTELGAPVDLQDGGAEEKPATPLTDGAKTPATAETTEPTAARNENVKPNDSSAPNLGTTRTSAAGRAIEASDGSALPQPATIAQQPASEPTGIPTDDSADAAQRRAALSDSAPLAAAGDEQAPDEVATPLATEVARTKTATTTAAADAPTIAVPESVDPNDAGALASTPTKPLPAQDAKAERRERVRPESLANAESNAELDPVLESNLEPASSSGAAFDLPHPDAPDALRRALTATHARNATNPATAATDAVQHGPRTATIGPPTGPIAHYESASTRGAGDVARFAPTAPAPAAVPVQQILSQIERVVRPGMQELRLRLDPPALGHITLRFALEGDTLTVMVRASRAEVVEALKNDLQGFADTLARSGIDLGNLDVALDGGSDRSIADEFRDRLADAEAREDHDARGERSRGTKHETKVERSGTKSALLDVMV